MLASEETPAEKARKDVMQQEGDVEGSVGVCDSVEQLCGGVENGRLAFCEKRVPEGSAVMPERQSARSKFFRQKLFLGQKIGLNITANQAATLKQLRPQQDGEQTTEGGCREPLSNGWRHCHPLIPFPPMIALR
jgi:hypothetical protein